jgi:peptidoglycan/LPS O-acetylase OafA/YrhL
VLYLAEAVEVSLVCLLVAAYALGLTDRWSEDGVWRVGALAAAVGTAAAVALVAHRVLRSDDLSRRPSRNPAEDMHGSE